MAENEVMKKYKEAAEAQIKRLEEEIMRLKKKITKEEEAVSHNDNFELLL